MAKLSQKSIKAAAEHVRQKLPDFAHSAGKDQWDLFILSVFGLTPQDALEQVQKLTPREAEVAELMAVSGLSNTAIAEKLGISRKTLDIHRGKINYKFKTTSHGIARIWLASRFAV